MHLYKKNKIAPYKGIILILFIFLVFISFFNNNFSNASEDIDSGNVQIIYNSISTAVAQCYAIEGTYPENIDYLEKHYGIIVDHEKYIVDYAIIGANIKPSIRVIKSDFNQ